MYFKVFPLKEPDTEEMEKSLRDTALRKVTQRRGEGMPDYEVAADSCTTRKIAGNPALRCVATFTANGEKMIEHLTWIRTNAASALLFHRVNEKDLETLREKFDQIADSVRLP